MQTAAQYRTELPGAHLLAPARTTRSGTGGNDSVGGVGGDARFMLMEGQDMAVEVGNQQGGVLSFGCVIGVN